MTKTKRRMIITVVALFVLMVGLFIGFRVSANRDINIETVTVRIEYYYFDSEKEDFHGTSPYPAFVANMKTGSNSIVQKCPAVIGYTSVILKRDENEELVKEPISSVEIVFDKNDTIEVFYVPIDVDYTIRLMQQDLSGSDYMLAGVINSKGPTETIPAEFDSDYRFPSDYADPVLRGKKLEEAFEGFTLMYHQPDTIAADGSTVFECYYDRNYYSVNFDLDGGYGVAPMYLCYGTELNELMVEDPEKAGFVFTGWEPALGTVTGDITYKAKWRLKTDADYYYTVIYRNEGLHEADETPVYYYWGSQTVTAEPDTQIDIDDIISLYSDSEVYHSLNGCECFDFEEDLTKQKNDSTIVVRGDDSTTVTLYYSRKNYKIWYTYARQEFSQDEYINSTEISDGDEFYIVNLPHNTAATANPNNYHKALTDIRIEHFSTGGVTYNTNGLKMAAFEIEEEKIQSVKFTFECVKNNGAIVPNKYYIYYYDADNNKKYLKIENQDVSLSAAPVETIVICNHNDNDMWSIYQEVNGTKIYLNDKRNASVCATGYVETASNLNSDGTTKNNGSKWLLCKSDEKGTALGRIYVPDNTGSGHDAGMIVDGYRPVNWVEVYAFPEVSALTNIITYDRYVADNPNNIKYRYYAVEIEAEFDSDIENLWPTNDGYITLYPVTTKKNVKLDFGSWAVNFYTPLRTKLREEGYDDHGNIVGPYPTMSSELIMTKQTNYEKLPAVVSMGDDHYVLVRRNADHSFDMPAGGQEDISDYLAEIMYAWWGGSSNRISEHAYEIYYEVLPGKSYPEGTPRKTIDGVEYVLDRTPFFTCAHNNNTRLQPFVYKGFETIDEPIIRSDGNDAGHRVQKREALVPVGTDNPYGEIYVNSFHYKRIRSKLTIVSYNSVVAEYENIPYGLDLSDKEPEAPDYPSDFPVGAYVFDGKWYTSERCLPEEAVDWEDFTMDDQDIVLYAGWKPNTFTVRYFADESEYMNNNPIPDTPSYHYYGQDIEDEQQIIREGLTPPTFTLSDGSTDYAKAVGWYYYHNDSVRAFDPRSMSVTCDMDLFMKWSTTVPANYNVHYYLKGTETKIASDTKGFSFVGLTKTFTAKTEKQLDPAYRKNYFPYARSTSLLLKSDFSLNEAVFEYAHREMVPYRVRYVTLNHDNTEQVLCPDKVVRDNNLAIVTEKHVPIENYIPKRYYITHIVTVSDRDYDPDYVDQDGVSPENVITFYYQYDMINIPYHIKYMLENEKGEDELTFTRNGKTETCYFREGSYIDHVGPRGESETAHINEFPGYEYIGWEEIVYFGDRENESSECSEFYVADVTPDPPVVSFLLNDDLHDPIFSKEVQLHYVKKKYPVKTAYSISSSDSEQIRNWYNAIKAIDSSLIDDLNTEVSLDGGEKAYKTVYRIVEDQKYGDQFSASAPEIQNYRISGSSEQSIVVANDDSFVQNKIVFIYTGIDEVMCYYSAVIPDKRGTIIPPADKYKLLSYNEESVEVGVAPRPVSAKPYVVDDDISEDPIYRFVGWYLDKDCTEEVDEAYLSLEDPSVLCPLGSNSDQHFYAKYDYIRGDLIITTDGCLTDDDEKNQCLKDQCFEFVVKGADSHNSWIELRVFINADGSKTIKGLPVGNYTVSSSKWAWRYSSDPAVRSVTVYESAAGTEPAEAVFVQNMTQKKWLDGNGFLFDD